MPVTSLPVAELLDGICLGVFDNTDPQWHALRAEGIGGSEVGTIAGLNKWESAYTLWAKKCGLISSDIPKSEAMEAGTRLEKVIVEWFADEMPELQIDPNVGTWMGDLGWDHANPDAIYVDAQGECGLIEIKTARFEDDWIVPAKGVAGSVDGIPKHYATQVQWYLRILGLKRAWLVVLFGGQKLRWYEIDANPFQQQIDLELATAMRECITTQTAPAWDGSTSTYETVRAINPDIVDEIVDIPSDLGNEYLVALNNSKQIESKVLELKSRILDVMGSAKSGRINGEIRCVRQAGRNGAAPFLVNKESK